MKTSSKVLAGVALAAVIGGGSWLAWGKLPGARFVPDEYALSSPAAVTDWLVRAVSGDRADMFFRAMTDEYRAVFARYFERLRNGEVPVKPWMEAAAKAGLADTPEELAGLSDADMFEVWWRLADRASTGIAIPDILKVDSGREGPSGILTVFYDGRDLESSKEAFVLYVSDGVPDLVHARGSNGEWRVDAPSSLPPGF